VGLGTLLLGFIFLLAIGLITIFSKTYKASTANPVKKLRTE
jgi:ABC-type antimicrobial peptide transport system permease subunit